MIIYLIQRLIDNCAWITLEAYKDNYTAQTRLKKIIKDNTPKGYWRCIHDYKIELMELKGEKE
jgi:hypothetical protein